MKSVPIDQASTRSRFETLPDELILGIMMLLGFKQWMVLACVSSTMRRVSRDNDLWKRYFPSFDPTKSDELLYQKVYDVFQNKSALGLASHELKANPEIVLAIVKKQNALQYADLALRDNPEIVNAAVKSFGWALAYASERLRDDNDIVLAAVNRHGGALKYASQRHRDDEKIVLIAVKQYGYALRDISKRLQNNKEIVLAAVRKSGLDVIRYSSKTLQVDKDVTLAVGRITRTGEPIHIPSKSVGKLLP